jgi:hypothetical protein
MAIFSAAILFHSDGYVENNMGQAILGYSGLTGILIFTYICLLFAVTAKQSAQRQVFLLLGALGALYGGLPWTLRIFEFNGDFYKFTNTDYWHILTLTLLTLIASIVLILTAWSKRDFAVHSVHNFLKSSYTGNHRVLGVLMIIPVIVFLAMNLWEIWQSLFEKYISFGDYFYSEILLIAENASRFLIALCGFAFLQPVLSKWITVAYEWNSALSDFSLRTYLTRKISSALYGLTYVLITAVVGIGVPVYGYQSLYLRDYFTGIGFLGPIAVFPIAVLVAIVIWFLVVLLIRLTYEFTNAIIHIAENTTK